MRTFFSIKQRQDPDVQQADPILRSCVHCGLCTSACPTYLISRDERNSPRGRIYLIKNLLETNAPSKKQLRTTQVFLDYCLDCRACETACPSGVQYGKLAQITRRRLDVLALRSWWDRMYRWSLLQVLTSPRLLKASLPFARLIKPLFFRTKGRLGALMQSIPLKEQGIHVDHTDPGLPEKAPSVVLFHGCVGSTVRPSIDQASRTLLNHMGYRVENVPSHFCCGSLASHAGFSARGEKQGEVLQKFLTERNANQDLVYTISGCGNALTKVFPAAYDLASFVAKHQDKLQANPQSLRYWKERRIVWHAPCSLRHGIKAISEIESLWQNWGLTCLQPDEAAICCGAAGSYAMLQPEMSAQLQKRKVENLEKLEPDIIITHNIGCLEHLREHLSCPILMVEEFIACLCGLATHSYKTHETDPLTA